MSKVALIMGATSMIGKACAHLYTKNAVKVMLSGRSDLKLKILSADLLTSEISTCVTDVTSAASVQSLIEQTLHSFQSLDALIYNVAVYPWKKLDELTLPEWQEAIDTNLTGAFLATQACIPFMKKQRWGRIIFISSIAGEIIGLPHMSAYATSKAAINGLMRTAAIELASYNITVNSISPGKIYDPESLSPEEIKDKVKPIPLGRFIDPMDIAEMALFLLSERAKNITGQNIIIDGGQSILGEESHVLF